MRRRSLILLVVLSALAAPAARAASTYTRVLRAYELNGSVPPCQFSSGQLDAALGGVDTYGAQYFQDFTAAVETALSARASGACAAGAGAGAARAAGAGVVAGPGSRASFAPLHPGPVTASTSAGPPAPLVLMAIVAAALLLGGGAAAGLRSRGGGWVDGWSHASAEARFRLRRR